MATYIEHGMSTVEKFVLIGLGIIFIIFLASVPLMYNDRQAEKKATPCSDYAEDKLSDIPAKCISESGGFKR